MSSSSACEGDNNTGVASTPHSKIEDVGGSGSSKKLPKNAPRNRSDVA